MKITGKFSADVVGKHVKRNGAHDGKEATFDAEISLNRDDAREKFGEQFETLAFSTLHVHEDEDGENSHAFLVDSIKPGRNAVFERHKIKIGKFTVEDQPTVLSIKPINGTDRVMVKIRIAYDTNKTELSSVIEEAVGGSVVKLEFSPAQGEFAFQAPTIVKHGAQPEAAAVQ